MSVNNATCESFIDLLKKFICEGDPTLIAMIFTFLTFFLMFYKIRNYIKKYVHLGLILFAMSWIGFKYLSIQKEKKKYEKEEDLRQFNIQSISYIISLILLFFIFVSVLFFTSGRADKNDVDEALKKLRYVYGVSFVLSFIVYILGEPEKTFGSMIKDPMIISFGFLLFSSMVPSINYFLPILLIFYYYNPILFFGAVILLVIFYVVYMKYQSNFQSVINSKEKIEELLQSFKKNESN